MPKKLIILNMVRHKRLLAVAGLLFLLSLVYYAVNLYRVSPPGVKKSLEKYIAGEEDFFDGIVKDSATLLSITVRRDSLTDKRLQRARTGIFTYALNDLGNPISNYWSTSQMEVNPADLKLPDTVRAVKYPNGLFELLKKKVVVNGQPYIVAGLIPLHWQYFIENSYLPPQFAGVDGLDKIYRLSDNAYEATAIRSQTGKPLFYIEKTEVVNLSQSDALSTFLHIAVVLLLVIFLIYVARSLLVKYNFRIAILFLAVSLFVLRLVVYYTSYIAFSNFSISSGLLPGVMVSSSDFLISAAFVFVFVAFLFFLQRRIVYAERYNTAVAIASLCLLAIVTNVVCDIVESLLFTLQGSFDITNFFKLSIFTFIGFVILVFIILTYYYFSWLSLVAAYKAHFSLPVILGIVAGTGLLLLTFQLQSPTALVKLSVLLWLMGYLVVLHARQPDKTISIFQSSFFLVWVILFSVSMSFLLVQLKKKVDVAQRQQLAEKFARQADPYSENVLRVAIAAFSDSFLLNNYKRFYDEETNRKLKDSLVADNFSGYLNKFDTRIYTFDGSGQSLYNDDETSYFVMDNVIRNAIIRYRNKNAEGLYFLKNNSNAYSYIYRKDIASRDSGVMAHLVVVAKPKRYKTDALYPELFRQAGDIQTETDTYLFAVYEDNYLSNYSANYPFADTLLQSRIPQRQWEEHTRGEYSELWYKAGNNKIVVLVKKNLTGAEFLTLSALLFIALILFACLIEVTGYFMKRRGLPHSWAQLFQFNIRTQVQATIILISFFSFVIIGIITIRFFVTRFNDSTQEKLAKTMQIITNEIQNATRSQLIFSDWDQIGTNADIDRKIAEIANLNTTDINLYDVSGNLKLSTQPYIYNRQILSNKMQPAAYDQLRNKHSILYMQDEYIKDFSFVSMYAPVKNDNDETIAYLNIPYLNSGIEVNQEISNLLVTLINLNAVIFVLAGVVAIFLTRSITSSLDQISDKMRDFQFGGKIEKIEWKRKDEIAVLVNTFNQMVERLEESAAALARSERAGAWQEMARQVAHEIKNPLTPMKLSAQYLQRAIESNASNVKELALTMSSTLIEQTDQLAKIAGDFSQFANINQARPEMVNLTHLLYSLCNLHTTGSDAEIQYEEPDEDYFIYADKAQINRLFTNLLKNAEEAASPGDEASLVIHISQYRKGSYVQVIVSDNGIGISPDKQQHIFEPNFTTKSSGTGLGLAICKRITENAGGKIWFETEEGKGTTFYVDFKLVNEA